METVDHRKSAGQGEPTDEKVGVVHLKRNTRDSGSGGGILSSAAAAVTNTFKSAKDAIMGGRGKDNTTKWSWYHHLSVCVWDICRKWNLRNKLMFLNWDIGPYFGIFLCRNSIPFGKKHFEEKSLLEPHGRVLSYLLINWVKFKLLEWWC